MKKRIKITPLLVEKLASCALTEDSLREALQLSTKDFNNLLMKREYASALTHGKENADLSVVSSLYRKAIGWEVERRYFTRYKGKIKSQKYIKRFVPNLAAIKFWLKNRRPDEWDINRKSRNTLNPEQFESLSKIAAERMQEMM
jgi:hypothetical protein